MQDNAAHTRSPARLALALLLALSANGASADIYRWVDGAGQVHYGDQPPQGVSAAPVGAASAAAKTPPPAHVPATPAESRPSAERYLDARRAERAEAREKAAAERRERELHNRQCSIARRDLSLFDNGAVIYGYDAKGERYALDSREREARRKSLQRSLRAACG